VKEARRFILGAVGQGLQTQVLGKVLLDQQAGTEAPYYAKISMRLNAPLIVNSLA
jgi:hypothetical protein